MNHYLNLIIEKYNSLNLSQEDEYAIYFLAATAVLIIIIYFLPKKHKPLIKIDSDNFENTVRLICWSLIILFILFNIFIFFTQPTYSEKIFSIERQAKDVILKPIDSDKTFKFSHNLYKFISSNPDEFYYDKEINFIWDHYFIITAVCICLITFIIFIVITVFNIRLFGRYED